jgi:hypothetical protein
VQTPQGDVEIGEHGAVRECPAKSVPYLMKTSSQFYQKIVLNYQAGVLAIPNIGLRLSRRHPRGRDF